MDAAAGTSRLCRLILGPKKMQKHCAGGGRDMQGCAPLDDHQPLLAQRIVASQRGASPHVEQVIDGGRRQADRRAFGKLMSPHVNGAFLGRDDRPADDISMRAAKALGERSDALLLELDS
jgi:hypothetical protein